MTQGNGDQAFVASTPFPVCCARSMRDACTARLCRGKLSTQQKENVMHAQDRKPEETQRKTAVKRHSGISAVTVGTHSPEAMRALQRSIGNAAATRMIAQERHAHGAGRGQAVQRAAAGPAAGYAVQRWPKGTAMQGYARPGISNAATDEMISYQDVGPERPSSPRAEKRGDELKGKNKFDVDLAANWEQGKRTGSTHGTSSVPISRNHRLSDHYIGHIIEEAAGSRRAAGAAALQVLEIDTAMRQFFTACAPSTSVGGIMARFTQFATQGAGFHELVVAASNNGRNLRAGHSKDNSTIQEHFDPGIMAGGTPTPITKSIQDAVNHLVSAKVIGKALAEEALQPYRGWTSSDIRFPA
ncbi:hypothetical protein G3I19_35600 [Streptomyces sp. SID10853]|uniref:hypothetical protein n=1 Tax=Streptomyces sp. SID10853 TaxID=2706028 RepID=UPI0013BF37D9|nr:hypothetical protein [Streptomyces sp. SID10853]NDZ83745.1 hypothetical protein [Streptomyces sp. SID10853]